MRAFKNQTLLTNHPHLSPLIYSFTYPATAATLIDRLMRYGEAQQAESVSFLDPDIFRQIRQRLGPNAYVSLDNVPHPHQGGLAWDLHLRWWVDGREFNETKPAIRFKIIDMPTEPPTAQVTALCHQEIAELHFRQFLRGIGVQFDEDATPDPAPPEQRQAGRKATQRYVDSYRRIYEQGEDRAAVINELVRQWVDSQDTKPNASQIADEQKRVESGIDYQKKKHRQ